MLLKSPAGVLWSKFKIATGIKHALFLNWKKLTEMLIYTDSNTSCIHILNYLTSSLGVPNSIKTLDSISLLNIRMKDFPKLNN